LIFFSTIFLAWSYGTTADTFRKMNQIEDCLIETSRK